MKLLLALRQSYNRLHIRQLGFRSRWDRSLRSTKDFAKYYSTAACPSLGPVLLQHLQHRTLIRVMGKEAPTFLQGLITNDVRHLLNDGPGIRTNSIYAMMLNQEGRVLYDIIIYKEADNGADESFLLECDRSLSEDVVRHLRTFKMRKKMEIEPWHERRQVWCAFRFPPESKLDSIAGSELDQVLSSLKDDHADSVSCLDPRQRALGLRLLLGVGDSNVHAIPALKDEYRMLRYSLGIAEGAEEFPPASALPLEYNADYLHGVSFHKGCYIGQELTARVHHTGVVRKRILPLALEDGADRKWGSCNELSVTDERGKTVGRPRGLLGNRGIGLMRLQECLHPDAILSLVGLPLGTASVTTSKPFWWPVEAPKDNLAAKN